MRKEEIKEKETFETLKSIRDISFIIGVYCLFSGWIYIYYYLNFFGISIKEAEIDYSEFGIYSYSVLGFYSRTFIFWVIIIVGIVSVFFLSGWYQNAVKKHKMFIVILSLFLFFPFVFKCSERAGLSEAKSRAKCDLKKVKFIFDDHYLKRDTTISKEYPGNDDERACLISLNDNEDLRLILANSEKYFVLEYDTCVSCMHNIYSINKEDVANAIIYKE